MGVTHTPPPTKRTHEVVVRYVADFCSAPDYDDWGPVCPRCGTAVGFSPTETGGYCCRTCAKLDGQEVQR